MFMPPKSSPPAVLEPGFSGRVVVRPYANAQVARQVTKTRFLLIHTVSSAARERLSRPVTASTLLCKSGAIRNGR